MKSIKIFAIFIMLFVLNFASQAQTSSLVSLSGGRLVYTPYANEGQSNAVNTIPDFSYAGYNRGGVALPNVPVVATISPSLGDNTQAIQDAINSVSALPLVNGFRGAILLKAGRYPISGSLSITQSGVVLRGEGQGVNGTVLFANAAQQSTLLSVTGPTSGDFQEVSNTSKPITTAYVGVGSKSFIVTDASGFAVGDLIAVKKTVNQKWIDDLGMSQSLLCGSIPQPDCVGWTPSSYTIMHPRNITAISGNTITIDIPIIDAIETLYGGGTVSKATMTKINNCGVENLRMESAFASATDEDHAWTGIVFTRVINSWVKNVTGQYFGFGLVSLSQSDFNTIQDCAMIEHKSIITGSRRYSFNINSGIGNLFQRCYTRDGRHDFVTGGRVTGPNVFLDCYADNTQSDIGPHQRWSTGILFDNIRGGQIRVQDRGTQGTGHGWVGAQVMFWNLKSYKSDIKVESPIGGKNWGIGCEGLVKNGAGFWESFNTNVQPRSLYLQQLEDRLGQQAVNNIIVDAQKSGNIYNLLANWQGEGQLFNTSVSPENGPSNWNVSTNGDYIWPYNFGAGTGNGTFTLSGNSQNSISTSTSTGILPKPVSGSVKIATASAGNASFALLESGTKDGLRMQVANNGNLGKFSVYNTVGATALTTYNFSLNFDNLTATRADWNLAVGSNAGETSQFNNTSGVPASGTNSSPELFGVLRFTITANNNNEMTVSYREKTDVTSTISITSLGSLITRGDDTKFELMCNNTATNQIYKKGDKDYTVSSGAYHLWINGIIMTRLGVDNNFPANQLTRGEVLNSFLITGNNGQTNGVASNDGSVIISKFSMQFANSSLPVSLVDFTGKEELGKVRLNWKTASESNNSHFEVLRSSDENKTAIAIGQINGKGNSNALVNYNFLDNSPIIGNNYYQLRQVDFDGKSSLSKTITVKFSKELAREEILIYPNPVNDKLSISSTYAIKNVKVFNSTGSIILNTVQINKDEDHSVIDLSSLAAGVYFISLEDAQGKITTKKIIIN